MTEDRIEQKVTVADGATAGDITLIGKIVQVVKQPALWQEAAWKFLRTHRVFSVGLLAAEALLAVPFFRYKNLYLWPVWGWCLLVVTLAVAGWEGYIWVTSRRIAGRAVVAILASVCTVGIIGWQTWEIAHPEPFEPDVFGIAVAELGEGPHYRRTSAARELSEQMRRQLVQSIAGQSSGKAPGTGQPKEGEAPARGRVGLKTLGVIANEDTATEQGDRIGADVVIWGQLLTTKDSRVGVRFQMLEIPDRAVNPSYPLVLPLGRSADIYIMPPDLGQANLERIVVQQATMVASFALGLGAYFERDLVEALTRFKAAVNSADDPLVQLSPEGKALLCFYYGRTQQGLGLIEEGQQTLLRAARENPGEPAIPMGLALGFGSLGEDKAREAQIDRALDLVDRWIREHPEDEALPAAWYDRGIIHEIKQEHDMALLDFQEALKVDSEYLVALISQGINALKLARFDEAEQVLMQAVSLAHAQGANAGYAHLSLAHVYEGSGRPVLAKSQYEAAASSAPHESWIFFNYAKFLESQGEVDATYQAYESMVAAATNKAWANGEFAGFCVRQGQYDRARDYYMQAVHAKPKDAGLRVRLADVCWQLGDAQAAEREYQQALEHGQDDYYVLANYAGFLSRTDDFAGAARFYERSLQVRPIDYPVLMNLGHTYEILGRNEDAVRCYRRLLELAEYLTADRVSSARKRLADLGIQITCD